MKKIMMMAVALATAATAFGQDDLVKQALKQKSNPAEAVKILTPALTSAETKDKAAAWGAMSEIQYQFYSIAYDAMVQNQFKTEKTPIDTVGMYNGVAESIKAAIKCDEFDMQPNEKGKIKPRYRSKNATRLAAVRNTLIDGGSHFYNVKDYAKAAQFWALSLSRATLQCLKARYRKTPCTIR